MLQGKVIDTRLAVDRVRPRLNKVGKLLMVVFTSEKKDNFRKVLLLISGTWIPIQ